MTSYICLGIGWGSGLIWRHPFATGLVEVLDWYVNWPRNSSNTFHQIVMFYHRPSGCSVWYQLILIIGLNRQIMQTCLMNDHLINYMFGCQKKSKKNMRNLDPLIPERTRSDLKLSPFIRWLSRNMPCDDIHVYTKRVRMKWHTWSLIYISGNLVTGIEKVFVALFDSILMLAYAGKFKWLAWL